MKVKNIFTILLIFVFLSSFAGASDQVDQEQTYSNTEKDVYRYHQWAQSFEPEYEDLSKISLKLRWEGYSQPPDYFWVRLYEDGYYGPGDQMDYETMQINNLDDSFDWYDFSFNENLDSGDTYWIVVDSPYYDTSDEGLKWAASTSSEYSDGGYAREDHDNNGWIKSDDDMTFKTYADVPECDSGWKCYSSDRIGYQNSDCSWDDKEYCDDNEICQDGECVADGPRMTLESIYTQKDESISTTEFEVGDTITLTAQSQNNGADGYFTTYFDIYIGDNHIDSNDVTRFTSSGNEPYAFWTFVIPSSWDTGTYTYHASVSDCSSNCHDSMYFTVGSASCEEEWYCSESTTVAHRTTDCSIDYTTCEESCLNGECILTEPDCSINDAMILNSEYQSTSLFTAGDEMTLTQEIINEGGEGEYTVSYDIYDSSMNNVDHITSSGSLSEGQTAELSETVDIPSDWEGAYTYIASVSPCNSGNCEEEAYFTVEGGELECDVNHADCDGNPDNGCEVLLYNNPYHCGACGNSCGANAGCVGMMCFCNENYDDCDGILSNGCEVNLNTDENNCGGCGIQCEDSCLNGECIMTEPDCSIIDTMILNSEYQSTSLFTAGDEMTLTQEIVNNGGEGGYTATFDIYDTDSNIVKQFTSQDSLAEGQSEEISKIFTIPYDWEGSYTYTAGIEPCSSGNCQENAFFTVDSPQPVCNDSDCGPNAGCVDNECACNLNYADCDNDWTNGCEVNIFNDNDNCGECGNSCVFPEACSLGLCVMDSSGCYNNSDCEDYEMCEGNICRIRKFSDVNYSGIDYVMISTGVMQDAMQASSESDWIGTNESETLYALGKDLGEIVTDINDIWDSEEKYFLVPLEQGFQNSGWLSNRFDDVLDTRGISVRIDDNGRKFISSSKVKPATKSFKTAGKTFKTLNKEAFKKGGAVLAFFDGAVEGSQYGDDLIGCGGRAVIYGLFNTAYDITVEKYIFMIDITVEGFTWIASTVLPEEDQNLLPLLRQFNQNMDDFSPSEIAYVVIDDDHCGILAGENDILRPLVCTWDNLNGILDLLTHAIVAFPHDPGLHSSDGRDLQFEVNVKNHWLFGGHAFASVEIEEVGGSHHATIDMVDKNIPANESSMFIFNWTMPSDFPYGAQYNVTFKTWKCLDGVCDEEPIKRESFVMELENDPPEILGFSCNESVKQGEELTCSGAVWDPNGDEVQGIVLNPDGFNITHYSDEGNDPLNLERKYDTSDATPGEYTFRLDANDGIDFGSQEFTVEVKKKKGIKKVQLVSGSGGGSSRSTWNINNAVKNIPKAQLINETKKAKGLPEQQVKKAVVKDPIPKDTIVKASDDKDRVETASLIGQQEPEAREPPIVTFSPKEEERQWNTMAELFPWFDTAVQFTEPVNIILP